MRGKDILTATTDHNYLRCSHYVMCREVKGNMEKKRKEREEGKDLKEKTGFGAGQKPTVYRPRHKIVEDVGR
jgi:hypothetical protein